MKGSIWLAPVAAILCMFAGGMPVMAEDGSGAPPSTESIREGKALYNQFCKTCHGINMVNSGTSSYDLRKFPHDDRARFVTAVMKGKNTMPARGDLLKPEEVDAIWAYVVSEGTAK